jgi:hypothetical protein
MNSNSSSRIIIEGHSKAVSFVYCYPSIIRNDVILSYQIACTHMHLYTNARALYLHVHVFQQKKIHSNTWLSRKCVVVIYRYDNAKHSLFKYNWDNIFIPTPLITFLCSQDVLTHAHLLTGTRPHASRTYMLFWQFREIPLYNFLVRIQWILLSFPGKAENVKYRKSIIMTRQKSAPVSYFPTFLCPPIPSGLGTMQLCLACVLTWHFPFFGILQQQKSWRRLRKAHRAVLQLYPVHHHHERNLCVNFAHRFDYF